jgi:hypothetical protein
MLKYLRRAGPPVDLAHVQVCYSGVTVIRTDVELIEVTVSWRCKVETIFTGNGVTWSRTVIEGPGQDRLKASEATLLSDGTLTVEYPVRLDEVGVDRLAGPAGVGCTA